MSNRTHIDKLVVRYHMKEQKIRCSVSSWAKHGVCRVAWQQPEVRRSHAHIKHFIFLCPLECEPHSMVSVELPGNSQRLGVPKPMVLNTRLYSQHQQFQLCCKFFSSLPDSGVFLLTSASPVYQVSWSTFFRYLDRNAHLRNIASAVPEHHHLSCCLQR